MRCPYCGSDNHRVLFSSHRQRRQSVAGAYIRCHQCQDCEMKFVSKQSVLAGEAAAELLESLS